MSIDTKALLDGVRERLHRLAKRNDLPTGLREWLVLCASETGTAADRLAALEAELAHERKAGEERAGRALAEIRAIESRNDALEQDNARLRGQISAMLGELEDFAMQNDLPIEDGHGYFGTGLPLGALQEWLFKQKDALAAGGDQ